LCFLGNVLHQVGAKNRIIEWENIGSTFSDTEIQSQMLELALKNNLVTSLTSLGKTLKQTESKQC
jgi:hypothetical protein